MAVTLRGLISDAPWRAFALAIISLTLGGCMQATLAPTTQAGWNTRDKELMSNLPYAQVRIPEGTTCCRRARRSATALPSEKNPKPGAASPRSVAWKNGHRGDQPPANRRGSGLYRPS
jgi:hypothetical protein